VENGQENETENGVENSPSGTQELLAGSADVAGSVEQMGELSLRFLF
jgi:hypothetical protein